MRFEDQNVREDLRAQKSDWVGTEACTNRAGASPEFWGMRLEGGY